MFYKHPEHKAVFAGDYIDGKGQHRKTVDICRSMVEQESTLAVMGNHEFNAIRYSISDGTGDYLRPHNEKMSVIMLSLLPSFLLVLMTPGDH